MQHVIVFLIEFVVAAPAGGAAWSKKLEQCGAGCHWAEIWCGSADSGRWVHFDPCLGWADVPQQVEGARGNVVYVVAFSGGAVKDVTARWVVHLEKGLNQIWTNSRT